MKARGLLDRIYRILGMDFLRLILSKTWRATGAWNAGGHFRAGITAAAEASPLARPVRRAGPPNAASRRERMPKGKKPPAGTALPRCGAFSNTERGAGWASDSILMKQLQVTAIPEAPPPKGRLMPAQGNALGYPLREAGALKGRDRPFAPLGVALTGLNLSGFVYPGRCPGLACCASLRLGFRYRNKCG